MNFGINLYWKKKQTMIYDSISDMLTRIRNASLAGNPETIIPETNVTRTLATALQLNGFIESYKSGVVLENVNRKDCSHPPRKQLYCKKYLVITLKYIDSASGKKPTIINLTRVSKPGRRVYVNSKRIPHILGGLGVALIFTSKVGDQQNSNSNSQGGIITDRVAREKNVGGELICILH